MGRPADVEGSHGQLRARLADRLRGDHANGLADIDTRAARQIAAVTGAADPNLSLTGQHRANTHRVNTGVFDIVGHRLVNDLAAFDDHFLGDRMFDVLGRGAAENPLT